MEPDYFKLTISNPCANEWAAMTPSGLGRFCVSCNKNVIDFTNQSEAQIKAYVKAHAGEKMCGRFYKSQIDRIRIEFDKDILHADLRFWQKFLVILLVCFGSEAMGIDFCIAQDQLPDTSVVLVDSLRQACDDSLVTEAQTDSVADVKPPLPFIAVQNPWITDIMVMGGIGTDYFHPLETIDFPNLTIVTVPEKDEEVSMHRPEVKSAAAPVNHSPVSFKTPIMPVKPRNTHQDDQQNLFVWDTASKKRKRRKKAPNRQ